MRCIVRNLSEQGACLAVDSPVGVPDTFQLVFDGPDRDQLCRAVWRSEDRLGVAFLQAGG